MVLTEIATTMHQLEIEGSGLDSDKIELLFQEMVQMSLWSAINQSSIIDS